MDRLRRQFFGEAPLARAFTEEWSPTVDISETKDKLIIKAELPCLEAKDVNVSISGDLLVIKGELTHGSKISVRNKNGRRTHDK